MQMKPSVEFSTKKTTIPNNGSSEQITSQVWSKSGNCPMGTIPVRRVSREDISRASSPSQFGRKTPHRYSFLDNALQHKGGNFNITAEKINQAQPRLRSEAFIVALGYNFVGAQSDINIWNPPRVEASDYSTAQIWLVGGLSDTFESVEAGWMVNPAVFGDSRTRLFISWTGDAYTKTGCINLLCAGFVQTSQKFALGATVEPVSSASSTQYDITVSVYLDPNSGNWWLTCANNVMGYWPGTLFAYLKHSATAVQWGGEVHSPNVILKKPHTTTSMGSGQWASYIWAEACYHTNIRIKDYSMQIKYPKYLSEYADESKNATLKMENRSEMVNRRQQNLFLIASPDEIDKIRRAETSSQAGAIAGAKAAAVAAVASAIPTVAAVRMFPWAKANLNYTAQALIISAASIAAFFITADKTILQGARRNTEAQLKKAQQDSK
ncbi:unnamed protein product [Arabidopsis arenosa]|uniref:Neprosin PEP catalytic domain-containing protein n=1 Tax=Arabidopsis arenosa TaxID=38785 RepID=A0A8S2APU8_ARAAE|nr:unnamed protein product [Arabidopsis arenosa]